MMTEDDAMMQEVLQLLLMDSDGECEDKPAPVVAPKPKSPPAAVRNGLFVSSPAAQVVELPPHEYSQLKKKIRTKLTSKRFVRRRKDETRTYIALSRQLKQEVQRLTMLEKTVVEPQDLLAKLRDLQLEEAMLQQELEHNAQWIRQAGAARRACLLGSTGAFSASVPEERFPSVFFSEETHLFPPPFLPRRLTSVNVAVDDDREFVFCKHSVHPAYPQPGVIDAKELMGVVLSPHSADSVDVLLVALVDASGVHHVEQFMDEKRVDEFLATWGRHHLTLDE
ncbi:hypothetical protein P43SY_002426 [Pythium insidiosum]|uniref:Uncharacterized protein n=1 Tax=Pythium insidiosum TaxID=114742 RepID=A0AAD5Q5P0_PYTIN|nr:hypothetical protein P43SY_002426 [Pythium insidiosum]